MRILNSLILIVFFSFGISIPFKNRYIVPLYLKVGLSVGYNDNIFLFSDEEKNDNDSYKYMGNSSTYDSSTIKPDIRILYSPHIVDGKTTNFIFYSSLSNYPNVVDNNSIYYSMRFEYKIKSYNWVKFGYRNSLNNFLRYYNDSDLPGNDYIECDYSSESIYVSYSLNFNEYGWSKFRLLASEQFYNPNFTEFDTRINEISFKHHLDYKLFQISISLLRSFADNISYKNGLLSTEFDRSYNSSELGFTVKNNLKKFFNQIIVGYNYNERFYKSELLLDPLHSGRSHQEHSLFIEIRKKLREDINIGLKYKVRNRKTISDFDWVESLKSFQDSQILMKITYDMDIDTFY